MAAARDAPGGHRRRRTRTPDGQVDAGAGGDARPRAQGAAEVLPRAVRRRHAVPHRHRGRRRGQRGQPAQRRRHHRRDGDRPDRCGHPDVGVDHAPAQRHGRRDEHHAPGPYGQGRRAGARQARLLGLRGHGRPRTAAVPPAYERRERARAERAEREPHHDLPAGHQGPDAPRHRHDVAYACPAQPAAGADRRRRRRTAGRDGHQGVGPGRHGAARPGHRRDRLRQVRTAAHARPRARGDALLRGAQLRPGRLQGRCDLPRPGRSPARRGGHHQPGGRASAGRPHVRRAARRDDPAAGVPAGGRQLRVTSRLRGGTRARRADPADADALPGPR